MRRHRPWLAAALALLVAGLGHAYLRRWGRAAVWFVWIFTTGVLLVTFVDPGAEGFRDISPGVLLPLLVVYLASAADAFRIGRIDLRGTAAADREDEAACPHCGKEVDPTLDFCTWCTEPIAEAESEE